MEWREKLNNYWKDGKWEEAIALLSRQLRNRNLTSREKAEILINRALITRIFISPQKALEILQSSPLTEIIKTSRSNELKGYYLWAVGTTHRFAGNISEALKLVRKSLRIFNRYRKGKHAGKGYALCALGGINRISGNFLQSLSYYEQASFFFEKYYPEDYYSIAYSKCGIGNAYRMLGEFEIAKHFLIQANDLYKKIDEKIARGYTLWSLALINILQNLIDTAIEINNEARKLFEATRDTRGIVYTILNSIQINAISGKDSTEFINDGFCLCDKYGHTFERTYLIILSSTLNNEWKVLKTSIKILKKMGVASLPWLSKSLPLNLP